MRNPLRTEAEAFSFVLVSALVFLAVALAGVRWGGEVALAVFLALGLGVAVGMYMKSEPKVREPAIWERRVGGAKRILVVANETVAGTALRREIVRHARDGEADVLVVTPALNSRLRHWTSDEDRAREEANRRLETSLTALEKEGITARGQVGDDDPLQAMEDALRVFGADEIIISTHPPGRSNWLEKDLITRAREVCDVPITHVVVDLMQEAAQAAATADE